MNNVLSIPSGWLEKLHVVIVGAGGTGSQVLTHLARIYHVMKALGREQEIMVTVIDDDTVSETNLFRQAFFPSDIGHKKAHVLVQRVNLGFCLNWRAQDVRLTEENANSLLNDANLVIGAVDSPTARKVIYSMREFFKYKRKDVMWMDCGNRLDDGQVILGHLSQSCHSAKSQIWVPNAGDLYPDLIDPSIVEEDTPSCSLEESLAKQSLFVNTGAAVHACSMLFTLLRYGQLGHHVTYYNVRTCKSTTLPIDPKTWERLGYVAT
ncbi:PRTRC system ThiF family protein [Flavobacterium sp.]|uniref:PRTRC system ThiF family protein n=1 Tax=Flavobacterium sp. TaxID=239 RepID=UPI00261092C0|nr:PRTRC system ThiF family protein [Flavobacterium sp.]